MSNTDRLQRELRSDIEYLADVVTDDIPVVELTETIRAISEGMDPIMKVYEAPGLKKMIVNGLKLYADRKKIVPRFDDNIAKLERRIDSLLRHCQAFSKTLEKAFKLGFSIHEKRDAKRIFNRIHRDLKNVDNPSKTKFRREILVMVEEMTFTSHLQGIIMEILFELFRKRPTGGPPLESGPQYGVSDEKAERIIAWASNIPLSAHPEDPDGSQGQNAHSSGSRRSRR